MPRRTINLSSTVIVRLRAVRNLQNRIALMEQQLRALKGRHHKAEEKRRREEAAQAKRDEARRQVLLGVVLQQKIKEGEISESRAKEWLRETLSNERDRALFGL